MSVQRNDSSSLSWSGIQFTSMPAVNVILDNVVINKVGNFSSKKGTSIQTKSGKNSKILFFKNSHAGQRLQNKLSFQ